MSGLLVLLLGTAALTGSPAQAAPAGPGPGFVDFNYSGSPGADDVTGYHNQSKLWFTDGSWWSIMIETKTASGLNVNRWSIYRLDMSSHTWVSTGVPVDPRNRAHPDVFWDESTHKLYVASSYSVNSATSNNQIRVYVYDLVANGVGPKTYVLDARQVHPGPDGTATGATGVKFATITKAANGVVWIGYASANAVRTMSSTDGGITWSPPAVVPIDPAHAPIGGGPGATAESDDVAAVTNLGSDVGILWSRSSSSGSFGGFFFAAHSAGGWVEGAPAASGPAIGDNHLSVKTASDGRILAAAKTSLNDGPAPDPNAPLIVVLERTTAGTWAQHTVSPVSQGRTRPMIVLDEGTGQADVFSSEKVGGGTIFRETAPLSSLAFSGEAAFISSGANPNLNDVTSTKQPVNSAATGLIVTASDVHTLNYAHGCAGTCSAAAGPTQAPAKTTTTLRQSATRSARGSTFSLTSTVRSGSAAPGGTVTFRAGATQIDDPVSLVRGSATLRTGSLGLGSHSITAVYTPPGTTLAPSSSPAVRHSVVPSGSRFVAVAATRVLKGRTLHAGRFTSVTLKAPAGTRAVALNLMATRATRSTAVSACAGNASAASCRAAVALRTDRRHAPAAAQTVVPLGPGKKIKLYNASGNARLGADVQGWYVGNTARAHFTGLSSARRVLSARKVPAGHLVTIQLPRSVRPAGTTAVSLNVSASTGGPATGVAVCRGGGRLPACRAHPGLFARRGNPVTNHVLVPVGKGGTISLANSRGTARVSVSVDGWYRLDITGSAFRAAPVARALDRRPMAARQPVTVPIGGLPPGTTSVVLRLTSSSASRNGAVSACAGGSANRACGAASGLLVRRGRTTTNVTVTRVGSGGTVKLLSAAGHHRLTVEVIGSFGRS